MCWRTRWAATILSSIHHRAKRPAEPRWLNVFTATLHGLADQCLSLWLPRQWAVFGGCLLLYFTFISGTVYNLGRGTPVFGETHDSRGILRPSLFLVGEMNEQVGRVGDASLVVNFTGTLSPAVRHRRISRSNPCNAWRFGFCVAVSCGRSLSGSKN